MNKYIFAHDMCGFGFIKGPYVHIKHFLNVDLIEADNRKDAALQWRSKGNRGICIVKLENNIITVFHPDCTISHLHLLCENMNCEIKYDIQEYTKIKNYNIEPHMKMYCLYPNIWGDFAFVMSDSKENALKAIIKKMKKEDNEFDSFYKDDITVDNLPDEYEIKQYDIDEVYIGEFS